MKFGIRGQFTDIITCVKFLVDQFRGYRVLIPPKLPFPIDLLRRPYDSVRTAVRHCDTLIPFYMHTSNSQSALCDTRVTLRQLRRAVSLRHR